MRAASACVVCWVLLWGGAAHGRSLDLFESYSLAAHGGLKNERFYNAGLQVFLGDEYQWPFVSAGGRLDTMLTKDGDACVPGFMAMISFYFDE